jgi:hypothetical protein
MVPRNVIPYINLDRQTTLISSASNSQTVTVTSNAVQLSSIPDSVILCVRPVEDNANWYATHCAMAITGVSVSFSNRSGILSSCQPHQLYVLTKNNGVNSHYLEFIGAASNATGGRVNTTGSFLKLNFGRDIVISDDFLSPGSLGQFQFQVTVNYTLPLDGNGALIPYGSNTLELVMCFVYPNVMVLENGSATTYQGLLSKDDVLKCADKDMLSSGEYSRMYGGSFMSFLKKAWKKVIKPVISTVARPLLNAAPLPSAVKNVASAGLSAVGMGYSAGGRSRPKLHDYLQ